METAAQAEAFLVNRGPLGASFGYTTTLLPNGKELIAGGFLQTTIPIKKDYVFSGADLLDPITGKWTKTGSMNVARYFHLAVLLPNGKVLVTGGADLSVDGKVRYLSSAELYDPTTGKWTITGSMHGTHANERATLQSNGEVLVFSGGWDPGIPIVGHELYDPATEKWTVITNK